MRYHPDMTRAEADAYLQWSQEDQARRQRAREIDNQAGEILRRYAVGFLALVGSYTVFMWVETMVKPNASSTGYWTWWAILGVVLAILYLIKGVLKLVLHRRDRRAQNTPPQQQSPPRQPLSVDQHPVHGRLH